MLISLLVIAFAVSLEPFRIGMTVLMLNRPRPMLQLLAFLCGGFTMGMTVGLVVLFVFRHMLLGSSYFTLPRVQILIGMLALLGTLAISSTIVAGFVGSSSHGALTVVAGVVVALVFNLALFMLAFKLLTAIELGWRELLPGVILEGRTTVAEGAVLGPSCHLVDCEIGPGARVSHTVATRAVIGEQCTVGPFAVLEAGTRLARSEQHGPFFAPGIGGTS